ncbi:MAG: ADP-ribosylation factor-like protein [Candidatus Lokiarchaeota archaeon]|nr:ADP-ribosylation factor-like protein [Candidatus Lokiarchaeota archaeon]
MSHFDEKALNVEAKARDNNYYTVGMDLGIVKLNGFDVFLFGTPGLLRFKVMRDVIVQGTDGIIFMFDAAHPDKDEDGIIILNAVRKLLMPETPIVYLANKQDLAGARHPEVVRSQNYLPPDAVIFPTSTRTGENLDEALKYIVNQIYENYSSILKVLRIYESDIEGLAKNLDKDKMEMRDLLNNLEIKRFIDIDRLSRTYKVREGMKLLM